MAKETIIRIEDEIRKCETLGEDCRKEILGLIKELRNEIDTLEKTNSEGARSVAAYAETSVKEAMRSETDPELLKHSLDGLSLAVRHFEVSHPGLVNIINNIGRTLATLGI